MKDRIKKIQEYSGLSLGVFASRTGIKSASLSHILNGRNNPSLDVFQKIHETFPEISMEWILSGKGAMLNGGHIEIAENKPVESNIASSTSSLPSVSSPSERTIFDNDPTNSINVEKVDTEETDDSEDIDDSLEDTKENTNVVEKGAYIAKEDPASKPEEKHYAHQKSESEIIDSFLKSDLYKNMLEAQNKIKEKSVKKLIILYDDETYAEYSLNKL